MACEAQRLGRAHRFAGTFKTTRRLEGGAGGEEEVPGLAKTPGRHGDRRAELRPFAVASGAESPIREGGDEALRRQRELDGMRGPSRITGAQERLDGKLRLSVLDEELGVAQPELLRLTFVSQPGENLRSHTERGTALLLEQLGGMSQPSTGAGHLGGPGPVVGAQEGPIGTVRTPGLQPGLTGREIVATAGRPDSEIGRTADLRGEQAECGHEEGDRNDVTDDENIRRGGPEEERGEVTAYVEQRGAATRGSATQAGPSRSNRPASGSPD